MKRFSIILGLIGVLVCWANAFATGPSMPLTPCPTTFTCAFAAAEVRPLADPATPGAPSVYVGYLSFNGSGVPTLDSLGAINGSVHTLNAVGTCTAGTTSALGILDFTGNSGPKFEFVSDDRSGQLELRVMIVADSTNTPPSAVNLGTCTQQ